MGFLMRILMFHNIIKSKIHFRYYQKCMSWNWMRRINPLRIFYVIEPTYASSKSIRVDESDWGHCTLDFKIHFRCILIKFKSFSENNKTMNLANKHPYEKFFGRKYAFCSQFECQRFCTRTMKPLKWIHAWIVLRK